MSPKVSKLRMDPIDEITPEMVDFYIKRARRIRSEAFAAMLRNMFSAFKIGPKLSKTGRTASRRSPQTI